MKDPSLVTRGRGGGYKIVGGGGASQVFTPTKRGARRPKYPPFKRGVIKLTLS